MGFRGLFLLLPALMFHSCAPVVPAPFHTGQEVAPPDACTMCGGIPPGEDAIKGIEEVVRVSEGDETYNIIKAVHKKVSSRFMYASDYVAYGRNEHWATPAESERGGYIIGDCDDFALYVREELKKRGIMSRLVLCYTEDGGSHLVVEVGGWILDNRLPFLMPRDELYYRWEKISGYELSQPWREINADTGAGMSFWRAVLDR